VSQSLVPPAEVLLLSLQVHLYLLTSRRRPALKPEMAVEIHQRCDQVSEVQFVHFIAMTIEHQFDVGHCRQAVGGLIPLMAVATVVCMLLLGCCGAATSEHAAG